MKLYCKNSISLATILLFFLVSFYPASAKITNEESIRLEGLIQEFYTYAPDRTFHAPKTLQFIFEDETPEFVLRAGVSYLTGDGVEQDLERAAIVLGAAHSFAATKAYLHSSKKWPPFPKTLIGPLGHAAHVSSLRYLKDTNEPLSSPLLTAFLQIASAAGNQNAHLALAYMFQTTRLNEERQFDRRVSAASYEAHFFKLASECTAENTNLPLISSSVEICEAALRESTKSQEIYLTMVRQKHARIAKEAEPSWALIITAGVLALVIANSGSDYASSYDELNFRDEQTKRANRQMESTWSHVGAAMFLQ